MSLFLAAFLQSLSRNNLTSAVSHSSLKNFGLPLCRIPSTLATGRPIGFVGPCFSNCITSFAHLTRSVLIYLYIAISRSLYMKYHSVSSVFFTGPKIALRTPFQIYIYTNIYIYITPCLMENLSSSLAGSTHSELPRGFTG